jgi:hypothetical protein
MFIRGSMDQKKGLSLALAVCLILVAATCLAYELWPRSKPNLAMAYFTDDDGASWFSDDSRRVAPFDHDGKTAVIAEVYSYDDGTKKFCAYVAKYTPEAKKKLEAALADAKAAGKSPDTIGLFHDHAFVETGMLVKAAKSDGPWLPYSDPRTKTIFSIHSPDGSAVDQVFVY